MSSLPVGTIRPYLAGHGKILPLWKDVAAQMTSVLGNVISYRQCRDRFEAELQTFLTEDAQQIKDSGTNEDYTEKQRLLQEMAMEIDAMKVCGLVRKVCLLSHRPRKPTKLSFNPLYWDPKVSGEG